MFLGAVVVLTAGIIVAVVLTRGSVRTPGCTVAPPGDNAAAYTFTPEQMNNAATISAVGTKLGLPAHAATVALATALQESKLRNLEGGDRDSAARSSGFPSTAAPSSSTCGGSSSSRMSSTGTA
ncbi:hypothetical protein AB0F15_42340, partial [Amycolatopsis sp. NPDC026612]